MIHQRAFSGYFYTLTAVVFVKALLLSFYILTSGVGLSPDEAQYWTWGQELSFGYYSKPPGIAWLIRGTTFLFGDSEEGVRVSAEVISMLLTFVVFFGAKNSGYQDLTAFLAALFTAVSPVGFFASFYATTDAPLTLFWTLALFSLLHTTYRQKPLSIGSLGGWIALACLFKWTGYLFFAFAFVSSFLVKGLSRERLFRAFLLSLTALFFPFLWNWQHGFPSFYHVLGQVLGGPQVLSGKAPAPPNPLDFFGAQIALLSPIFFLFVVGALLYALKNWNRVERRDRLLVIFSIGIYFCYQFLSFFTKIQGNWAVFIYPALFLLGSDWFVEKWKKKKTTIATVALLFALVESLIIFSPPFMPTLFPYRWNRFRECMGNSKIPSVLADVGFNRDQQFLLSSTYQGASLLSFYGKVHPHAYFLNIEGRRLNQFSFWKGIENEEKKEGFFLAFQEISKEGSFPPTDSLQHQLEEYFEKVVDYGRFPLYEVGNQPLKAVVVYAVSGFRGKLPPSSHQY